MKPQSFPWQLVILLLTFAGIVSIYQSSRIDNAAILALVGGACLLMGLISLRQARQAGKSLRQSAAQCGMGALVLCVGAVETFHVRLPQAVWYAVFAGIVLLLLFFTWSRKRK